MLKYTKQILSAPLAILALVMSLLFSRRVILLVVIAAAGVLAWGPWLRPPLSRDFRGTQLTWNTAASLSDDPLSILESPRDQPLLSIGFVLLVAIAVGGAILLLLPATAPYVFGGLLVLSVSAVASCQFNHPALIEVLEIESEQRRDMRRLFAIQHEDLLTGLSSDRVYDPTDRSDLAPIGLIDVSASRFQMFGPWLVGLLGFAFLATTTGAWQQRIKVLFGGLVLCLTAAAIVAWPRGVMQYQLDKAYRQEMNDKYREAQQSLAQALDIFPSLHHTRRFWLASGRLAYRLQENNLQSTFFQAHQLMLDNHVDDAIGILQPPAEQRDCPLVVRDLMSELLGRQALRAIHDANPGTAETRWREAFAMAPWRQGNWLGIGVAMSMASPHQPARIEEWLLTRIEDVGDRLIRADAYAMVGDAYFSQGEFIKARDLYQQSRDTFSLPKYVNIHAQEGMLGL